MGVTLDYSTVDSVESYVRAAILADLNSRPPYDWWCEPIIFYDHMEEDGRWYGGNKIFLIGYSTNDGGYQEVQIDDENFMACKDAFYILSLLSEWSLRFGVSWSISLAGDVVGTINNGKWDDNIIRLAETLFKEGSFDPNDPTVPERAKAISTKYASRN